MVPPDPKSFDSGFDIYVAGNKETLSSWSERIFTAGTWARRELEDGWFDFSNEHPSSSLSGSFASIYISSSLLFPLFGWFCWLSFCSHPFSFFFFSSSLVLTLPMSLFTYSSFLFATMTQTEQIASQQNSEWERNHLRPHHSYSHLLLEYPIWLRDHKL